ncbi:hypothetical protein LT493_29635 [Streptomyces tricolor]|nr:hypothetical protein [Streptomyces tricolor]
MSAADDMVVATWSQHSDIGHHYEDLLADGRVISPPFGEDALPRRRRPRLQQHLQLPRALAALLLPRVRRLHSLQPVQLPPPAHPAHPIADRPWPRPQAPLSRQLGTRPRRAPRTPITVTVRHDRR